MATLKPIPDAPAYYACSDGFIHSLRFNKQRKLRPKNKDGYLIVRIKVNGRFKTIPVHRAVALAFHGPPPDGLPQAAHINDVKHDNKPSNIRWCNQYQNYLDAIANGKTQPPKPKKKKTPRPMSALAQKILDTYRFNVCGTKQTAKVLGCNEDYVREVIKKHSAQRQLF